MTIDERARKITETFSGMTFHDHLEPLEWLKKAIAAELRSAVEETDAEWREASKALRSEDYADAAKIMWEGYNSGMNPSEIYYKLNAMADKR